MKCLNRNKIKFFYANFVQAIEITDEYGNKTGEREVKYGKPKESRGNISASKGELSTQAFGLNEEYDRAIVLENGSYNISENSVLWIDVSPRLNQAGELMLSSPAYDYIVKKIARSLNNTVIAVAKVNVK